MKNLPAIPHLDKRLAAAIHYHEMASASAAQMAIAAAKCGLELKALKKDVGAGGWIEFVEQHFGKIGMHIRTAQRYMALADGLKGKALKNDTVSFLALLDSPPSKLTQDEQKKLTKEVGKITDGATLSELYQDFGIVKKPQGSSAKGGNTRKEDAVTKEVETADVIAEGNCAATRLLITALEEALNDKPFNAADKAQRKQLHGLLVDLSAAVKETL